MKPDDEVLIVGQGLAGTCLAWRMWDRRIKFRLLDRTDRRDGTAGAGIVTPVTGHGMHLEWQVDRFLDEAVEFGLDIGPAGEIIRLAEEEGQRLLPRVKESIRECFGKLTRDDGSVWAGSSSWFITAYNPA